MKFDNQLRYAVEIIHSFRGGMPLHTWLKDFFRNHRQMGSRDRKLLSSLVYSFYRLGHAAREWPLQERLQLAFFLVQDQPHEWLAFFRPDWNERTLLSLEEKIAFLALSHSPGSHPDLSQQPPPSQPPPTFRPEEIFLWREELTAGIDPAVFNLSFLRQPDLFLRIRPGHQQPVIERLEERQIPFAFIPPHTLRLPNGTKLEQVFAANREIVIQDYSSQQTAPYLQFPAPSPPHALPLTVWDACAASGGKSLLVHDLNPSVDLTVSDIRESILHNLRERFREAGIKNFRSFVADLSSAPGASAIVPPQVYDLVIADVPCSGSGTWSRTPEELCFFDKQKIAGYSSLQRKIVERLIPSVKAGGRFVYITCSVFRQENEDQIAFILERSGWKLEKSELLKGYDRKADTLFVARFIA